MGNGTPLIDTGAGGYDNIGKLQAPDYLRQPEVLQKSTPSIELAGTKGIHTTAPTNTAQLIQNREGVKNNITVADGGRDGIFPHNRGGTPSTPHSTTQRAGISDTPSLHHIDQRPGTKLNIFERWLATNTGPSGSHPPNQSGDQLGTGPSDRDFGNQYKPISDCNVIQSAFGSTHGPTPLGQTAQEQPLFEDPVLK